MKVVAEKWGEKVLQKDERNGTKLILCKMKEKNGNKCISRGLNKILQVGSPGNN